VSSDAPDIGAILRRFAQQHGQTALLSGAQRQALNDLGACRTAALGGRIEQCNSCGQREFVYNSCRNRHCPKCQAHQRAVWLEREAGLLLPVAYHHVVFTLPAALNELVVGNARLIYTLLFEAASDSIREVAADPKHLGAQVGLTAVLHTWGQTLSLHPHLHIVATGGGLSCNRQGQVDEQPCWRSCRPGFFLPVRVLSPLFRGKFLAGLLEASAAGQVRWPERLRDEQTRQRWLAQVRRVEWVVFSKAPCVGAEVVLKYLARYTYRVACSNSRLVAAGDEAVTFTWKDYRHGGRERLMTLSVVEFARRFLQHVLPKGFVRIRHYGLLANRSREEKLTVARRLLSAEVVTRPVTVMPAQQSEPRRCRHCGVGLMQVVEGWPRLAGAAVPAPQRSDSS
jgi:hypothetical protein